LGFDRYSRIARHVDHQQSVAQLPFIEAEPVQQTETALEARFDPARALPAMILTSAALALAHATRSIIAPAATVLSNFIVFPLEWREMNTRGSTNDHQDAGNVRPAPNAMHRTPSNCSRSRRRAHNTRAR
jgi:hypothetical protein